MRDSASTTLGTVVSEALDNAWLPLVRRCEGLTDAEYLWEPVSNAWSVRESGHGWVVDWTDPDPDPAPVTTIAWRCWHVAVDCLDSYSARLFGRRGAPVTGTNWTAECSTARGWLADAGDVFLSGVRRWSDDELMQPLGRDWGPFERHTNLDLVHHALREIVHHGAEIALLRDLYGRLVMDDRTGSSGPQTSGDR